jgi:hypothetical protein
VNSVTSKLSLPLTLVIGLLKDQVEPNFKGKILIRECIHGTHLRPAEGFVPFPVPCTAAWSRSLVVTATFEAASISAAVVSFDLRRAVRFGFFLSETCVYLDVHLCGVFGTRSHVFKFNPLSQANDSSATEGRFTFRWFAAPWCVSGSEARRCVQLRSYVA